MQAAPVNAAHERDVSNKLRRTVHVVARLWERFVQEDDARAARLACADAAPTWQDVVVWSRWLLTSRCQQTATEALLGRTRVTVVTYVTVAQCHVFRNVYPSMQEMERRECGTGSGRRSSASSTRSSPTRDATSGARRRRRKDDGARAGARAHRRRSARGVRKPRVRACAASGFDRRQHPWWLQVTIVNGTRHLLKTSDCSL